MLKQAEGLLKEHHYEQSVEMLRKAASLAEARNDKDLKKVQQKLTKTIEEYAEDVNRMGEGLYKRHDYKEAIHYYAESLNIIQEVENSAKFEKFEGELNKAIEGLAQEISDQGDQLMAEQKFEEAVKIYAESIEIIQRAGNEKKLEKFQTELGRAYAAFGLQIAEGAQELAEGKQWEDAIKKFEEALGVATKGEDPKVNAKIETMQNAMYASWAQDVNAAGDKLSKEKKFDEALPVYSKAMNLAEKSKNAALIAQLQTGMQKAFTGQAGKISAIGAALVKERNFQNAIEVYSRALEIAKQSKDAKLTATYQKEIDKVLVKYAQSVRAQAEAEAQKGDFPKAAQVWKDCWSMARTQNAPKFLKETEDGFIKICERWAESDELKAQVLASEGKWEIAIALYAQALQAVTEVQIENLEENLKAKMANLYADWAMAIKKDAEKSLKRNQLHEALDFYDKAIAVAGKSGDEKAVKSLRSDRDQVLRKVQKDSESTADE